MKKLIILILTILLVIVCGIREHQSTDRELVEQYLNDLDLREEVYKYADKYLLEAEFYDTLFIYAQEFEYKFISESNGVYTYKISTYPLGNIYEDSIYSSFLTLLGASVSGEELDEIATIESIFASNLENASKTYKGLITIEDYILDENDINILTGNFIKVFNNLSE